MDIHALTYFKKVAELQHMTRAAQELRVAQPALSRTISGLEQELGVKLFERKGKSIALNQYGTILLRHTQRILQEMSEIERDLSEAKGEATRTVTITLYAASKLLPRLVMEFKKNYPTIILHIVQQGLDTEQKEPDLSLFSSIQPCSGPNEVTLIQEEILLALPESNPLSRCSSLNLRQVAGEEFICLQKGKSLRTITDWYCKMAGFEPNVIRVRQPGDSAGTDPGRDRNLLHSQCHLEWDGDGTHLPAPLILSALPALHQSILEEPGRPVSRGHLVPGFCAALF